MLLEVQNIKELNYLEHVVKSLKEYGYQVTFLEEKIKGLKEEYEEKRESLKEKVEQRISLTTENSKTKEQEFMIKLHLLRQEMNKPILLLDFLESTESFKITESDKKLFEKLGDAYLESLLDLQDSVTKKEEIIRRYYDLVLKKMLTMYQENTLENKEELKENNFLRDSILRYLKEKGVMVDNVSYHSVKETLDSYLKEKEEIEVISPPVVAIDREKRKLSMIESFFYKIGAFFSRLFSDEEEDALFLEKKKEDASFFTILSEEDYNNLHLSGIMNATSSSYAKYLGAEENTYFMNTLYLGIEQNSYLMNTILSDGVLCNSNGLFVLCPLQDKTVDCRIAIPIDKMPIENIENAKLREDGILEIEYGYYPKEEIPSNVDVSIRKERIDRRLTEIWRSEDRRKTLYQSQGNLYLECSFEKTPYTSRFFTIDPQKWYYRRGDCYAISKDIVFGGVPFEEKGYFNGSFQKTTIKKYLDTIFWEDFKRYTFYYDKYKTIEETCNLPSFDLLTKEHIENSKVLQCKGKYANKTDYATLCGNESPAYYLKD